MITLGPAFREAVMAGDMYPSHRFSALPGPGRGAGREFVPP